MQSSTLISIHLHNLSDSSWHSTAFAAIVRREGSIGTCTVTTRLIQGISGASRQAQSVNLAQGDLQGREGGALCTFGHLRQSNVL